MIEVDQSSYVRQIGVKYKRVTRIHTLNDLPFILEICTHESEDTLIALHIIRNMQSSLQTADLTDRETDACALSVACQSMEVGLEIHFNINKDSL